MNPLNGLPPIERTSQETLPSIPREEVGTGLPTRDDVVKQMKSKGTKALEALKTVGKYVGGGLAITGLYVAALTLGPLVYFVIAGFLFPMRIKDQAGNTLTSVDIADGLYMKYVDLFDKVFDWIASKPTQTPGQPAFEVKENLKKNPPEAKIEEGEGVVIEEQNEVPQEENEQTIEQKVKDHAKKIDEMTKDLERLKKEQDDAEQQVE